METKTAVVIVIVVLAALVAYIVLTSEPTPPPRDETELEEFALYLQDSPDVYIIMDAREAESTEVKKNINQCGADLAGSMGLVGKTLHIFALNQTHCITLEGTRQVWDCLNEFNDARTTPGTSLFYIKVGDEPTIYENELVVGINETYQYRDCNIGVIQPPPAANETIVPETNESESLIPPENETAEEPFPANETGMNETAANEG